MNALGPFPLFFCGDFNSQHIWKSTITQGIQINLHENCFFSSQSSTAQPLLLSTVIRRMGVILFKLYFDELAALIF